MENVSDIMADAAISRSLLLQRIANGMSAEVANHYQEIIDDILNRIRMTDDEITIRNMRKLIKELRAMVETDLPTVLYKGLTDLGLEEAAWASSMINTAVGVDIVTKIADPSRIERIVKTSLMEGATISEWFNSLEESMKTDLERSIKLGVTQGETTKEIVERVANKLAINKNQAESITRTAVATVSNQARDATWEENSDIFRAWEHHSVMDGRVSFTCSTRDGAEWSFTTKEGLNEKGKTYKFARPPLHFRCRSILLPVLKNADILGITSTRATMDGQISSEISFDKWFDKKSPEFQEKYLGVQRYKLYKAGKITFKDLVDQRGNALTVRELREQFG